MYLIRVDMPLHNRATISCLQDCQKMHRLVTQMFSAKREAKSILYCVKTTGAIVSLYIYSHEPVETVPEGLTISGQKDIADWVNGMQKGQSWRFSLLTAPFKKVAAEQGENSRRRILRTQEERFAWMHRKAEQSGFSICAISEQEQQHSSGVHSRDKGGRMVLDAYRYQGILKIENEEAFRRALCCGIGPEKAYGMGMLLLSPV